MDHISDVESHTAKTPERDETVQMVISPYSTSSVGNQYSGQVQLPSQFLQQFPQFNQNLVYHVPQMSSASNAIINNPPNGIISNAAVPNAIVKKVPVSNGTVIYEQASKEAKESNHDSSDENGNVSFIKLSK